MRKFLLFIFLLPGISRGQEQKNPEAMKTADKGTFQFDGGIGLGLYNAFDNINHGNQSGINAGATIYAFKLSYLITDRFSIGGELKLQQFLTDEADTNNLLIEASGGTIQLHSDYHFSNRKKFNAWIGCGIGVAEFNYKRTFRDSITFTTGEVNANGISLGLNSGFRWYVTRNIGLFTSVNFAAYPLRYRSFRVNGIEQEFISFRKTNETIFNLRGFEGKIGLCFRIGMNPKKQSDF